MFPTQCIQAYYLDQGSKTADATCEQCFASGENVTKYNATSTRVITSPSESIMYGNNAPGEGFRDVAVAVRGVGDCVLPWSCAEEQLE